MEGCDVLTVNAEDKIEHLDAYLDSGDVARQLGVLPPAGSRAETNLTKLANARTRARAWIQGSEPERIAEGVWLVRGGIPKMMNVYLIEDEGGVTVFDCGVSDMAAPLAAAAARLGGIKRIVLGHADADHRGAAPGLNAPVYCHPADRAAAESRGLLPGLLGPREARSARPHRALAVDPDLGRRAGRDRRHAGRGRRGRRLQGRAPPRPRSGADRRCSASPTASRSSRTRSTRSTPRAGATSRRTSRIRPSTRTPSRRGRRSASSPRSTPPSSGPATPTP